MAKTTKIPPNHPLQLYLNRSCLTCSYLAKLLHVTRSCVYFWLIGKTRPRPDMAVKLAKMTKDMVPITAWGYNVLENGKIIDMKEYADL